MRTLSRIGCLLALSGCAVPMVQVQRPSEGFNAIRFERAFDVRTAWQVTSFPAGQIMIQDRVRASDGAPLFCGGGGSDGLRCVELREDRIRVHAETPTIGEVFAEVPPGTIVRTQWTDDSAIVTGLRLR